MNGLSSIRWTAGLVGLVLGACAPKQAPPTEAPASAEAAPETTEPESTPMVTVQLHPELQAYVQTVLPKVEAVPDERRAILDQLAEFVVAEREAGRMASLLFICTHNSRRSHMSQLWAATAAAWYGIDGVETFSGGTEATAFNPRAVAAMERAGFAVENPGGDNPHYSVTFGPEAPPMIAFSKTWQDEVNPDEGFAAVMTCSQADEACPFVRGSKLRIALSYVDPKVSDGTLEEAATYDERAQQIATEMFYLFARVAQMS